MAARRSKWTSRSRPSGHLRRRAPSPGGLAAALVQVDPAVTAKWPPAVAAPVPSQTRARPWCKWTSGARPSGHHPLKPPRRAGVVEGHRPNGPRGRGRMATVPAGGSARGPWPVFPSSCDQAGRRRPAEPHLEIPVDELFLEPPLRQGSIGPRVRAQLDDQRGRGGDDTVGAASTGGRSARHRARHQTLGVRRRPGRRGGSGGGHGGP